MSLTFTDINTGATIILQKTDIACAYNGDDFPQIITATDIIYDIAENWAYVYQQINGQPPPTAP